VESRGRCRRVCWSSRCRCEREESGGIDVALVGDEHDAVAVADAEAAIDGVRLDLGSGAAFFAHVVEGYAAIGGSFGGLDGEGRFVVRL